MTREKLEEERQYGLHGWLDLCEPWRKIYESHYLCDCGRVYHRLVGSGLPALYEVEPTPTFVYRVRRNVPWRVFKNYCKVYGIDHKEYIDI